MKRIFSLILTVIAFSTTTGTAIAADSLCEGVFTKSFAGTAAQDHLDKFKKGDTFTMITQYNVDKHTGTAEYCSHGGGCYPAVAIRLLNCKVDLRAPEDEDADIASYGLILERDKIDPETLRIYDVERKLLDLGVCSACANGLAEEYVKYPKSKCGRIVKNAIEGDLKSREKVTGDNPC